MWKCWAERVVTSVDGQAVAQPTSCSAEFMLQAAASQQSHTCEPHVISNQQGPGHLQSRGQRRQQEVARRQRQQATGGGGGGHLRMHRVPDKEQSR